MADMNTFDFFKFRQLDWNLLELRLTGLINSLIGSELAKIIVSNTEKRP